MQIERLGNSLLHRQLLAVPGVPPGTGDNAVVAPQADCLREIELAFGQTPAALIAHALGNHRTAVDRGQTAAYHRVQLDLCRLRNSRFPRGRLLFSARSVASRAKSVSLEEFLQFCDL